MFSIPPLAVIAWGRFTYWERNGNQDVFELNGCMRLLNILVWDICLCLKAYLFISTTVYIEFLENDSHTCCMMWVFNTIHSEKMWNLFLPCFFPNEVKSQKFANLIFLCTQNTSFQLFTTCDSCYYCDGWLMNHFRTLRAGRLYSWGDDLVRRLVMGSLIRIESRAKGAYSPVGFIPPRCGRRAWGPGKLGVSGEEWRHCGDQQCEQIRPWWRIWEGEPRGSCTPPAFESGAQAVRFLAQSRWVPGLERLWFIHYRASGSVLPGSSSLGNLPEHSSRWNADSFIIFLISGSGTEKTRGRPVPTEGGLFAFRGPSTSTLPSRGADSWTESWSAFVCLILLLFAFSFSSPCVYPIRHRKFNLFNTCLSLCVCVCA